MRVALVAVAVAACHGAAPPPVRHRVITPAAVPGIPPDRLTGFDETAVRVRLTVDERITGHVEIAGRLAAPSTIVWLHAADLDIQSAAAVGERGERVQLYPRVVGDDRLALRTDETEPLAAGAWTIEVDYETAHDLPEQDLGPIVESNDHTHGAFRETFEGRRYVYTMGEPDDTRRFVPCVDEPNQKVPWTLALDVPLGNIAASNAPAVRDTPLADGRHHRVEFAPTAPLPSYLLAFAIGPFDVVPAGETPAGHRPIRVLVPAGHQADAALAVETLAGLVGRVEAWTDIPYPFAKLDFVAMPQTGMIFSAMENAGMVTYRADLVANRAELMLTALHEIVHQWFGDLVTPAWWNDIWLNESFAVWLSEELAVDAIPGFSPAEHRAWLLGLAQSMPVRPPPAAPADPRYFGGWRGAVILQMLEAHAGAGVFRDAIRGYLRAHAGKLATTDDLEHALGAPLGEMLHAQLDGQLPTVTASVDCTRHRVEVVAALADQLPVCVAYGSAKTPRADACVVLAHGIGDIPLARDECPTWVMPNAGANGAYVWISPSFDALVTEAWPALTASERMNVARELPSGDDRMALVPSLADARDPAADRMLVTILLSAHRDVPADLRAALDAFILRRFADRARALDFHLDFTRGWADAEVMELVALAGDGATLARGAELWANPKDIPASAYVPVAFAAALADRAVAAGFLAHPPVARSGSAGPRSPAEGRGGELIDRERMFVLRLLPDLFSLLTPEVIAALPRSDAWTFLSSACTADERDAAAAMAPSQRILASTVTNLGDECIARRAALAPAFRSWLAPAKPKPRR